MIKSRRLRWAGHITRMKEGSNDFNILTGKYTRQRLSGIDGRSILEWILKKYVSIRMIGLIRLRMGLFESPCECEVEPPGPISHEVSYQQRKKRRD